MRKTVLFSLVVLSYTAQAQKDLVIFRDGTEKFVQVTQVNSNKTLYLEGKGKKAIQQIADNENIYMIKYKKRGNVYFSEDGERITGNAAIKGTEIPKNTVVIYLRKGQEMLAYDFSMESRIVRYKEDKKKRSPVRSMAKSDIFMIRYADGTKEVLIDYGSNDAVGQMETVRHQPLNTQLPRLTDQPAEEERTYPVSATITLKKNKKVIEAIVHADDGIELRYKRVSNPDGPMYKQPKKDIYKITYNN